MTTQEFMGFAGVRLQADTMGDADAPAILCITGAGNARMAWASIADGLLLAGRRVILMGLRGHGASEWPSDGRYDEDAFVGDVLATLSQLPVRPVVVASGIGAAAAMRALAGGRSHLASGLILLSDDVVAEDGADRIAADDRISWAPDGADHNSDLASNASSLSLPVLAISAHDGDPDGHWPLTIPGAEYVAVERDPAPTSDPSDDVLHAVLIDFLERRCPLAPPEYRVGSDARTFRDALGCYATGVTVVTAMGPDGVPIGLTANSFTSVSLDPPLLLVCIANSAGSGATLSSGEFFAVNVLQIGQQLTSNRFAGKGEDRFAQTPWHLGEYHAPVLGGSLASFECTREAVYPAGDHFILVGRVLKASFEPRRDPLLYFRGKYRRLHFA